MKTFKTSPSSPGRHHAFSALALCLLLAGCDATRKANTAIEDTAARVYSAARAFHLPTASGPHYGRGRYSAPDELAALGNDTSLQQPELRGLPSITDLPPALPGVPGLASTTPLSGPTSKHLAWTLSLPLSSPRIHFIGADDTVYLSGYSAIVAAREGRLLWAFHIETEPRLYLGTDNRLWWPPNERGGFFVLNRAGKGGVVPVSVTPAPDPHPRFNGGCGVDRDLVIDNKRAAGLDYECARPQAQQSLDGTVYVATEAPDLRAYTPQGVLIWKLETPCTPITLLAGPAGHAFFSCKDHSLHLVHNGVVQWTRPGDGDIDETSLSTGASSIVALMDRTGNLYFTDNVNSSREHIHALDPNGNPLWTLSADSFSARTMEFDTHGRLLITGDRGSHAWLLCLSNK